MATVAADRFVGLFGLIWFSAVFGGGFWLAGDPRIADNTHTQKIVIICSAITVAAILGWIVMGFLPTSRADRFAARLKKIPKLGNTLAELWFAVWTYRQRPKVIYATIGMTAAVHLGFVLMFHFAVRVFPVVDPASLTEHFVIAPIGYIMAGVLPGSGWTWRRRGYFRLAVHAPRSTDRDRCGGSTHTASGRVGNWARGVVCVPSDEGTSRTA